MSTTTTPTTSVGAALDLDHHLGVLRRRWITVLLVLLLVVGATAYVTSRQAPQYRASVHFVIGTLIDPTGQSAGNTGDGLLARMLSGGARLETQTAAIESLPVAERAALLLGTDRPPQSLLGAIDASLTTQQVLVISARSSVPQDAVNIAHAFVDAYLGARSDEAITQLLTAQQQVQERLDRAIDDLAIQDALLAGLQQQVQVDPVTGEAVAAPGPNASVDPELVAARNQRDQMASAVSALEQQLANLDTTGTIQSAGGQIIRPAVLPTTPFSPQPVRNMGLALILGLTLGLGLAYLRDYLDDAIRSDHDINRLVGRPIVGRIPLWDHDARGRLITITEPASPVAEAYRTLRTNVRFLGTSGKVGSVLVTSPAVGEGKTTTSANLAIAFARLGNRVLLVDGDLRRPNVDNAFSSARTPGLSEVLVGEVEAVDALQDVGIPNLRVLPAGTIPPNPSELLGSPAMTGLIAEFKSIADLVIIDAPPLLAVSDSIALASSVDHTIMVVEQGGTGRSTVRAAMQQLANVDTQVAGVVMNAITESDGGYQYSYYYREYTADLDEKGRRRRDKVKQNADAAPDAFTSDTDSHETTRR